jgi:hypothetical protein
LQNVKLNHAKLLTNKFAFKKDFELSILVKRFTIVYALLAKNQPDNLTTWGIIKLTSKFKEDKKMENK